MQTPKIAFYINWFICLNVMANLILLFMARLCSYSCSQQMESIFCLKRDCSMTMRRGLHAAIAELIFAHAGLVEQQAAAAVADSAATAAAIFSFPAQ